MDEVCNGRLNAQQGSDCLHKAYITQERTLDKLYDHLVLNWSLLDLPNDVTMLEIWIFFRVGSTFKTADQVPIHIDTRLVLLHRLTSSYEE